MSQTFHRDRFTWMAYLFFAFYCFFINLLGPLTPFLKEELDLSYTVSSLHFTAFAVGVLLISLSGQLLIQRIGRWPSLWIGAFGISASALVLVIGRSPVITIGASFFMGLLGALNLIIIPTVLSDHHREHRAVALSEAMVIVSLACTAAPLLVGWSANLPGGWRLAVAGAALLPIGMRLYLGSAAPSEAESDLGEPGNRQVIAGQKLPGQKLPGQKLPGLYWVYWTGIMLSVAVEFCMISWSADYLETGLGMAKVDAVQAVSLFLGAMIVGRFAGSRLVLRFATPKVVTAAIGVTGLGFLLFWTTHSVLVGLAGLFITGLGVASLYPLILTLAMEAAGDNAVQASARATLASGTAVLILPLALGRLADLVGIRPAYGVVGILVLGLLLMILLTQRTSPAYQSV